MTLTKPEICYRSDWNALPPKSNPGGYTALDATVVHYTAANWGYAIPPSGPHSKCVQQVQSIQRQHQNIPDQSDIEYSALTCNHGVLFEGRVLGIKGGANGTAESNKTMPSICCLLGVDDQPSDAMLNAVCWFHKIVEDQAGRKLDMKGHKQIVSTSCPGNPMWGFVYSGVWREMIDGTPEPEPIPPTPGDDDMPAPDVVQVNEPYAGYPTGAVFICAPDCMEHRWVKDEDELWQLKQTFARRGWVFPDPIPPIPANWMKQYGVLIIA